MPITKHTLTRINLVDKFRKRGKTVAEACKRANIYPATYYQAKASQIKWAGREVISGSDATAAAADNLAKLGSVFHLCYCPACGTSLRDRLPQTATDITANYCVHCGENLRAWKRGDAQ